MAKVVTEQQLNAMGEASRRQRELERALDVVTRLLEADDRRAAYEAQSLEALHKVVAQVELMSNRQALVASKLQTAAETLESVISKMGAAIEALSKPRPRSPLPEIEVRYDAIGNIESMGPRRVN